MEIRKEIHELKLSMLTTELEAVGGVGGEVSQNDLNLTSRIQVCEAKNRMFADTVVGMADQIKDLQKKLEQFEINAAKRTVILSGIELSDKKKYARKQLDEFLQEQLRVDVELDDFYYIGKANPQDVVMVFTSSHHKRLIFQNSKNIQHLRNSHGKKYNLRNYNTPNQQSAARTGQFIADEMVKEDAVNREEISMQGNQIYIGDKQFKPKITPPRAADLLRLPNQRLNEILGMWIDTAPSISLEGNRFTAYSVATAKYETIQDAYSKIRLNHANAKHIVCAWSIPASKFYESKGYCDDDDHGVGQPILQMMQKNNITHRAIYIVRDCGKRLYGDRVRSYLQAAEQAIQMYPDNPVAGAKQVVENVKPDQPENDTYSSAVRNGKPPRGTVKRFRKNNKDPTGRHEKGRHPTTQGNFRGQGRGTRGRGGGNTRGGGAQQQGATKDVETYIPRNFSDDEDQMEYTFSEPVQTENTVPKTVTEKDVD